MGFFLPVTNNYIGSTGSTGSTSGTTGSPTSIYPFVWNPTLARVESDDPDFSGYNRSGTLNVPKVPSNGLYPTAQTVAPAAARLPSLFPTAGPAPVSAGPTPTYPINIPNNGAVSGIAVPKSQVVNDQTNAMFADLGALRTQVSGVLADFNKQFPDFQAGQAKTLAAENAVTSGLYSGAEKAHQDALLRDYEIKANAANAKSIADTQRLRSRTVMATGGTGNSGADRAQFAAIANINAQAAKDSADRALISNQWLTNLQQAAAGTQSARNRLTMGDTLLPATVGTSMFDTFSKLLASLAGTQVGNLTAGIVTPGGYLADTFGGSQAYRLADLTRLNNYDLGIIKNQIEQDKNYDQNELGYNKIASDEALIRAGLVKPYTPTKP